MNDGIVVTALDARANFGKLLRRVEDEGRSLVIEKRGSPRAVLLSIRDYVRLAVPEPEEVLALEPDLSLIPTAMVGAIGAYPDGSEHAFEMRTFAPGVGVAEDPVCGSMNASVGQWLTTTGAAPSAYRVSQGARVGRAGTIEITVDADGTVWVGGAATGCIRGTITL